MACSTSVLPSCGPPFVPRLMFTAQGRSPARSKMNLSASTRWTESPNVRPTTSGPSHGMSPAESSTKTRSAFGATPGVPGPAAVPGGDVRDVRAVRARLGLVAERGVRVRACAAPCRCRRARARGRSRRRPSRAACRPDPRARGAACCPSAFRKFWCTKSQPKSMTPTTTPWPCAAARAGGQQGLARADAPRRRVEGGAEQRRRLEAQDRGLLAQRLDAVDGDAAGDDDAAVPRRADLGPVAHVRQRPPRGGIRDAGEDRDLSAVGGRGRARDEAPALALDEELEAGIEGGEDVALLELHGV